MSDQPVVSAATPVTYLVPCEVTARVTLSPAGQARVQECIENIVRDEPWRSEDEARHLVLLGLAQWIGEHGRRPENLDGYADLTDDDVRAGYPEWGPSSIDNVEVVVTY